ncbi:MAG: hypothetical protein WB392_00555 [Methanotrichaceae archaeon]
MKIDSGKIPKFESRIEVGEALRIGNRTLHFLTKVSIMRTEDENILGGWADPLAMVVSEQNKEYVFSFTGQDLTIDQLMEMAPSLRDVLNKDKGIYKIKIV